MNFPARKVRTCYFDISNGFSVTVDKCIGIAKDSLTSQRALSIIFECNSPNFIVKMTETLFFVGRNQSVVLNTI